MMMRTGLLATALLAASGPTAGAQSLKALREQVQSVCLNDVLSVCREFIPYEDDIMRCMQTRHDALSPPCRQAFDAGMKAARKLRRP